MLPDGVDSEGLSGADPLATPSESDEQPGATETNFLTPPCRVDSDCRDGRRCVGGARQAAGADAGREQGARDAGNPGDAGSSIDAGGVLGRCERPDAG